ncbi:MAG TPA: hypothetical protein VL096_08055 [Pirellulaceae bacterium]|nr:hypothetical protein [Pirellulaceae bacterium]
MNLRHLSLLLAGWLLLGSPVRGAEFAELAAEARTAMAQRDLPTAKKKLEELKAAAVSNEEKTTAERLDTLNAYLFDFWKAVHSGGNTLQGTDELVIGDKRVAVVEYDEVAGLLILRVEGVNKRYTLKEMPPRVAITLASQVLKKDAPVNQAFIGTFLAMDSRGDRKLAREAWDKAAKGGTDIKDLLPELDIPLSGAATLQIPALTPATAGALRPQFWSLMQNNGKAWKPLDASKVARQDTSGRLEIAAPAEPAGAAWFTFKRKLPASFGVRIYLVDLPAGQKFGLFNGKDAESDASIELPTGTVKIEFARQAGELICRINDEEKTFTAIDKEAAKTNGNMGFTLPAGGKCFIAGCEFVAK